MKQQLYIMVKDSLKRDIENHKYDVGDKLPSENELCEIYNVGKSTVRKALNILVNEGFIYSVNRTGYFVNEPKNDIYEFVFDELKIRGETPDSIDIVYATLVDINEAGLYEGSFDNIKKAIKVGRIFNYLSIPCCYEEKYLFYTKSFKVDEEDLFNGNSADLLNEFISNYTVKINLKFKIADSSMLKENYLKLKKNVPLFVTEQTYLDTYDRPLGICRNYYISDSIEIRANTLKNSK